MSGFLYLSNITYFIIFVTMIDLVYKTLLTIINKENQGYVSPTEFNLLAHNVQSEIFRGYFEDENRDKNKENKGMTNKGYANLDFNERQRITQFASKITIDKVSGKFTLPEDLYFIEDDGVVTGSTETHVGKVIEEVERSQINYLNNSISKPTVLYPIYERYSDNIEVYPTSIQKIDVRYLRVPKMPNWTYFSLLSGDPLFNPADTSFQDFELHNSEFSNIVLRMLSHFGLNLRETDVIQIAETLKDKMNIKDNS